jgi:hypothetical protein
MCLPVQPYKVEREWKHAGLSCAIVQGHEGGNRCGYVRVPPTHPMHGKSYDDIDVAVHGGLTFSELEPCKEHEDGQGYWFGFDCAHCGDMLHDPNVKPEDCVTEEGRSLQRLYGDIERHRIYPREEHFWSLDEVVAETERLAEQLVT